MNEKKYSSNNMEKVVLRQRAMKDGGMSLYLDIHHNGKRKREFLSLYLLPNTSAKAKAINKQTMILAETIRAKKQVEMSASRYQVLSECRQGTLFLDYYRSICIRRFGTEEQKEWGLWKTTLHHLEQYCDESTTFSDINSEWIEGFKKYLYALKRQDDTIVKKKGTKLSQSTLNSYFNKLKACINQAFSEKIIPVNPLRGIKSVPAGEVKREHLSWEELIKLDATSCKYPELKRAFLFSCFTGLRKVDITNLKWRNVMEEEGMTRIEITQQKTSKNLYIDISDNAAKYLGHRGPANNNVFQHFKWSQNMGLELRRWLLQAGIGRYITFHCARHTFAVLMLNFGVDIYTVSKLLGHKELHTTQLYAKVLDKKKQEAASMFPDMNDGKDDEDNNDIQDSPDGNNDTPPTPNNDKRKKK